MKPTLALILAILLDFAPGMFFFVGTDSPESLQWWAWHLSFVAFTLSDIALFVAWDLSVTEWTKEALYRVPLKVLPWVGMSFKVTQLIRQSCAAVNYAQGGAGTLGETFTVFDCLAILGFVMIAYTRRVEPEEIIKVGFKFEDDESRNRNSRKPNSEQD